MPSFSNCNPTNIVFLLREGGELENCHLSIPIQESAIFADNQNCVIDRLFFKLKLLGCQRVDQLSGARPLNIHASNISLLSVHRVTDDNVYVQALRKVVVDGHRDFQGVAHH